MGVERFGCPEIPDKLQPVIDLVCNDNPAAPVMTGQCGRIDFQSAGTENYGILKGCNLPASHPATTVDRAQFVGATTLSVRTSVTFTIQVPGVM